MDFTAVFASDPDPSLVIADDVRRVPAASRAFGPAGAMLDGQGLREVRQSLHRARQQRADETRFGVTAKLPVGVLFRRRPQVRAQPQELLWQAPVAVLRGPGFVFDLANPLALQIDRKSSPET